MASSTLTIPRSSSPSPLDDPPPSATSYLTAPQSPNPSYSSRSPASSTHTLPSPRESDQTTTNSTSNPLHALALGPPNKSQPQEVHIVQLTDDALHLQSTTSPDSSINIIHKVGHHHSIVTVVSDHSSERESLRDHRDRRVDQRSSSTGPDSSILRPSSPSSHSPNNAPSTPEIIHYAFSSEDDQDKQSRITQPSPSLRPVTFDDSSLMMRERQPSTASSSRHYSPSKYPPPAPSSTARLSPSLSHVSRPSADTTKSSASASGSTRTLTPRISRKCFSIWQQRFWFPNTSLAEDQDGLLHPSPPVGNGTMPSRPSRRNTTGSTSTLPSIKPVRMATLQSFPHTHDEIDLPQNDSNITTGGMSIVGGMGELGELESDIQLQAEQIRRERMSKRAKAEKARAEDQLARTASISTRATATVGVGGGGGQRDEVRPLVGNLIGEDHVNYVLMYNMLTGIRIAVCGLLGYGFERFLIHLCGLGLEVPGKDPETAH